MRVCRKCGDKYSLVNHPTYPSGTPKPDCRPCIALYAKKQRAKRKTRPQYVPDYTEMRDPDPAVMEASVKELEEDDYDTWDMPEQHVIDYYMATY